MSRIRLLVADVDGTLVTRDNRLTAGTCEAVARLRAAGVALAITSGRPPRGMAMLVGPLGLTTPIAAFNGAMYVQPDLTTVVQQCPLPLSVAVEAVDYLLAAGLDVWVYRGADWFIRDAAAPHAAHEQHTVQFAPTVIGDLYGVLEGAVKIVGVSDDHALVARAEAELRQRVGAHVSAARSQLYYLDVTHPDANKGMVVRFDARALGVPLEEVAAIGDMPSDVLMFGVAAKGIAMGNASPEVQRTARYVTTSNEEEGFARAVEAFVLGGGPRSPQATLGLPDRTRACLFDLDGVLTRTSGLHAAAWKQMFDTFLRKRAAAAGEEPFIPFDAVHDYASYVDGKLRFDGAHAFLAARGIELPDEAVRGLAERKDEILLEMLAQQKVETYDGSLSYLRRAREAGLRTAVVSSSKHTGQVLASAGIGDLFDARIDGVVAGQEHLAGKPAPDTYLAAARTLAVAPDEAVVFEDALAGVEAGRAGHFGYVVGVDRVGQAAELRRHGADVVVPDLAALLEARMIQHPSFRVEPWALHETALSLDVLAQTESLFALSNGHIGLRGNLDEGEPHGLPGSYLNGFFELRPLSLAESQFGAPESSQTLINVTNAKVIRLLVDDEPFDVRYGQLRAHDRVLDFRAGTLTRTAEWVSPAHRCVRVTSVRFVSFTHRAIMGIVYEVEPVDGRANIVVQSELVANEELPSASSDPRVAAALESPLVSEEHMSRDAQGLLIHRTRRSGLRMAACMDHEITGTSALRVSSTSVPDLARVVATDVLEPGQKLRLVKLVAYGWSHERTQPALRDQAAAAIVAAQNAGWEALLAEQRAYLDDFWQRGDVELEGDTELQQAVRFALFHILSAGARAEGRAIAAKGLTGTGYDGHAFWDTDLFIVPVLTYTAPEAAADALRWRHSTLDAARARARDLGLAGAAFPWRTIHGEECSGYWPAGTAAFHINADVASSVIQYVHATGDDAFERDTGLDILVETARLWRSLGHYDIDGSFRIDGVTGPDEYSALTDNNLYTNLMAQRNLRGAAAACQRHQDRARELGVTPEEMAAWRAAAGAVVVPYDDKLRVHQQSEGFTQHETWDFASTRPDQYPLLLHFAYFDLYRKQVIKQPDLVLAMQLCSDAFTPEERARNFEYYERITVRDSSLSAGTEAVAAADAGHVRLAFDYAAEAALMDLDDREHNARDGLHVAALGGTWMAFVVGLGGMREQGDTLAFTPRLPDGLTRLTFSLLRRGICLRVDVTPSEARYSLPRCEGTLTITHYGEPLTVVGPQAVVRPIAPAFERPPPAQPAGREPRRRSPG